VTVGQCNRCRYAWLRSAWRGCRRRPFRSWPNLRINTYALGLKYIGSSQFATARLRRFQLQERKSVHKRAQRRASVWRDSRSTQTPTATRVAGRSLFAESRGLLLQPRGLPKDQSA
jgi:hypothetical protein